jgi:hypothetical protein
MSTHIATEARAPAVAAGRSWRERVVGALGPLTLLAGVVWGVLQPWRITLLHPHGQGFWWLFVEPPLLVALVGAVFHLLIAPSLIRDLREVGEDAAAR